MSLFSLSGSAASTQCPPLSLHDALPISDRVADWRDLALLVSEYLGHQERLRQETLDPAGAGDDLLVFLAQFLDAEDGDDVLQLRSEEHTSELQSRVDLVCRLLLEKKKSA